MNAHGKIITLLGPTASGKTALARILAKRFAIDLISVDSAQIYRGMDIGTGKPTRAFLRRYPHALIDIREPEEAYSAAAFCADSHALITRSHDRERVPLLVGGSMLYFYALFAGLSDLPRANPALRAEIEAEIARDGLAKLHAALVEKDPRQAQTLSRKDHQRIARFTELMRLSGKPPSQLFAERVRRRPPWPACHLALFPERATLHETIARRFHDMMTRGFLREVEALRKRPSLTADHPSMRSVGYRQLWRHLDGEQSLEEAVAGGIAATRQLAKRQITWMNNRLQKTLPLQRLDPGQKRTQDLVCRTIAEWIA